MRILGIDPGSRIIGFALIEWQPQTMYYISSGVIKSKVEDFPQRLHDFSLALNQIIVEHTPDCAAIESMFFYKNAKTLMQLCHARGVLLAAMAANGVPVAEYAPCLIKKSTVGVGNASKQRVGEMVQHLLRIEQSLAVDAADAAAVAITHGNHLRSSFLEAQL